MPVHSLLMEWFSLILGLHKTSWHLGTLLPFRLIGYTMLLGRHLLVLLLLQYRIQALGVIRL